MRRHRGIIQNGQELEITQIPATTDWTYYMCVIWSHSRILHSNEKEPSIATLDNMDESHDRLRKRSQRENKAYNSIHRKFKNRQNYTIT